MWNVGLIFRCFCYFCGAEFNGKNLKKINSNRKVQHGDPENEAGNIVSKFL